ncbi:MAG TPA: response regulator transcription factor [Azospirillum sp.]|nr:response regulator transcription factor [Azospirillum sp.]
MTIVEGTPDTLIVDLEHLQNYQMIVLGIGGAAASGRETLDRVEEMHGVAPKAPLVIVSDREESQEVIAAFQAGARGYIPTSVDVEVALKALSFILSGGSFFPPTALLHPPRGSDPGGNGDGTANPKGRRKQLTPRQQDVLSLLRMGKANKMIARELGMQESTVKVHVRQIMRKYGAMNRTEAALLSVDMERPERTDDHEASAVDAAARDRPEFIHKKSVAIGNALLRVS